MPYIQDLQQSKLLQQELHRLIRLGEARPTIKPQFYLCTPVPHCPSQCSPASRQEISVRAPPLSDNCPTWRRWQAN